MKDKDSEILIKICETAKPLLELILSRYLVVDKRLNEKQKKLIRKKPYVWGYINTLVDSISKSHIKDQLTNRQLLLLASHQIYSAIFLVDNETAKNEYAIIFENIKKDELIKKEFADGISDCEYDLEKMKVREPNKLSPLNGLNQYLLKKYEEINEK